MPNHLLNTQIQLQIRVSIRLFDPLFELKTIFVNTLNTVFKKVVSVGGGGGGGG